jgi:hypothetical protein
MNNYTEEELSKLSKFQLELLHKGFRTLREYRDSFKNSNEYFCYDKYKWIRPKKFPVISEAKKQLIKELVKLIVAKNMYKKQLTRLDRLGIYFNLCFKKLSEIKQSIKFYKRQ